MYVLVIGGGKVGLHLARTVKGRGQEVAIVEARPARAQLLRGLLGDIVVTGNGTLPSVLDAAGCARADVLAVVTGYDEVNLLAAVQGARHFGVRRVVARLNDPRNERLFRRSGVEATVSSSAILADLIEREVSAQRVRTLLTFAHGGVAIVQVDLSARSAQVGRQVRAVHWPPRTLLVAILRDEGVEVPTGSTALRSGDRLLLLAPPTAEPVLQQLLAPDAE